MTIPIYADVPESAVDVTAVRRQCGHTEGSEDFAFFKCPSCGQVYLLDCEDEVVYSDSTDLQVHHPVKDSAFACVGCHAPVPEGVAWVGPQAPQAFRVTWGDLRLARWEWAVREDWQVSRSRYAWSTPHESGIYARSALVAESATSGS